MRYLACSLLILLLLVCFLTTLLEGLSTPDPVPQAGTYWSTDCGGYTSVCRKTGHPTPTPPDECIGFIGCSP